MACTDESFLDRLYIAAPCDALWNKMSGDERVRHCALCKKNVYNLSEMSRGEAESLIRAKEGNLCVRFFRRADGTILTQNCPVGLRAIQRRLRWMASGFAAALCLAAGVVFAQGGTRPSVASLRNVAPFSTLKKYRPFNVVMDWFDPPMQATAGSPPPMGVMMMPQQKALSRGTSSAK